MKKVKKASQANQVGQCLVNHDQSRKEYSVVFGLMDRDGEEDHEVPQIDVIQTEDEFVLKVYDQIAADFDRTRYKPWPGVTEFINSLERGSLLCDIGCGNGKYFAETGNGGHVYHFGCDTSFELLKICQKRNCEVAVCDVLNLPFKTSSIDNCICIAVLHHLASVDRRIEAIKSITRVLIEGGKCLIYVWAMEQEKDGKKSKYLKSINKKEKERYHTSLPVHSNRTEFKHQDLLVPWMSKNDHREYLRYCHVFREDEIEDLISQIDGIKIVKSYFDQGNWCVIFEKTKRKER